MKKWLKATVFAVLALATVLLATACSDPKGYEIMDEEGYTVSVKFDANGGAFTTGVTVMVDSYNLSNISVTDDDGNKLISLIPPDDDHRGTSAKYTPTLSDCFLAGWYRNRTEKTDSEGNVLDINGNIYSEEGEVPKAYVYSDKWDFEEDKLAVNPDEAYTASEPVITLYAAWVPLFTAEIKDIATGETVSTYTFDPTADSGMTLQLPYWNTETDENGNVIFSGDMNYGNFSSSAMKENTFNKAYLDAEMMHPINESKILHTASFDVQTATAENTNMTIYAEFLEGKWYKISTPENFKEYAKGTNNLFIEADLDFKAEDGESTWPYITSSNFGGKIVGNCHKISNVSVTQDTLSAKFGLFGELLSGALLKDLHFDNITVTVKMGANPTGSDTTPYGIIAGKISDGVIIENITLSNSKLLISPDFMTNSKEDFAFGLVCGRCSFADKIDVTLDNVVCEELKIENPKHTLEIETVGQNVYVEKKPIAQG